MSIVDQAAATGSHTYTTRDVAVAGGPLRVGLWEPTTPAATSPDGAPLPAVVLVHGITASHRAWPAVVSALPGRRVLAPDLRGRGRSNGLPGPYGMAAHADDVAAVIRALAAGPAVVVGHSMGGFVSLVLTHRHPDLVARLVLVDGGLPIPLPPGVPDGATPEELVRALLGPAIERLTQTFPSAEAYREFWRAHPAFAEWNPVVEQYVDYDLAEYPRAGSSAGGGPADGPVAGPVLRPATSSDAVAADSADSARGDALPAALAWAAETSLPITFLRAPRGLLDQPGGMYPAGTVAEWERRLPRLAASEVVGVNHYTIIMAEPGISAVAAAVG
ncbi:alpha/beta fold hydrolase [Promicromonospora sp. NPDC057138]|uniref:alpha/beta fold hydrolase n=1 Tax=Promicromonospora sp. NPDC057138 TaxID=3346031 RepID=UPI00362875B3